MHTPLYYAVLNNNIQLINLLTDNMNEKNYNLFLEKYNNNPNNYSPLMLLYNKMKDNFISDRMLNELLDILFSVTKKLKIGYLNNVARYLLYNYPSEKVSIYTNNKNIFSDEVSNLNKIIQIYNYLIKNCNIDINIDIDDKGNNIFFLSAMENNFDLFNDILIKEKNINYNRTNKEGKSLIHYIVSPHPLYSYQNESFLKLAINSGFNPNIKDNDGLTPLDYAKKYKYLNLIKILSTKVNNISEIEIKKDNMDIEEEEKDNNINYNYNEVSDKYYKEKIEPFIQRNTTKEDKSKSLVTRIVD